jgi:lipoprotein-releasing system permease protein
MNLSLNIARRYIFGKKSTSAINYITMISISGIAVGTTALLLVLSVFNGLEDLIKDLYSSFQPDIMVTPLEGKVFEVDSDTYTRLTDIDGVKHVSRSLEETAFFEYEGSQGFGMIKGVDDEWLEVSRLDSVIYDGEYKLKGGQRDFAVVGYGIRNNLGISVEDYLSEMTVYMLKNKTIGNFEKPFKKQYLQPAGIFSIQQQFDEKYVITNLDFAQELRGYKKGEVSQLEIKLKEGANEAKVKKSILAVLGNSFETKNRYEQNSAFFKLMKAEKWMGFAITLLTMMMVAINMIGCMLMLVHEKKKDIAILKSMGANNGFISNIFLGVGTWMTGIGLTAGFVLGLLLYWLHKTFNLVPMEGFVVDAYPASMRFWDFVVIIIFVLVFGISSSIYPAYFAARIKSLVRND